MNKIRLMFGALFGKFAWFNKIFRPKTVSPSTLEFTKDEAKRMLDVFKNYKEPEVVIDITGMSFEEAYAYCKTIRNPYYESKYEIDFVSCERLFGDVDIAAT